MTDPKRELLRYTVATLAYRAGKTVRGAPPTFAMHGAETTDRTPAKILTHLGDLMDWGLAMSQGRKEWHDSAPLAWDAEVERFFAAIKAFDDFLASDALLAVSAEKLFQGPVADALTHTGQLAMLRRMAGCKMRGESYFAADIVAGRVGTEQAPPKREFD